MSPDTRWRSIVLRAMRSARSANFSHSAPKRSLILCMPIMLTRPDSRLFCPDCDSRILILSPNSRSAPGDDGAGAGARGAVAARCGFAVPAGLAVPTSGSSMCARLRLSRPTTPSFGFAICPRFLGSSSALTEATADAGQEIVGIERLGNDVGRAELLGDLEEIGVADTATAGNGDDLGVGPLAPDFGDRLDAFLLGHDDVGDHQVRLLAAERGDAALAVLGADYLIAAILEDLDDGLTNDNVIIDHQNLCRQCRHHSLPMRDTTRR